MSVSGKCNAGWYRHGGRGQQLSIVHRYDRVHGSIGVSSMLAWHCRSWKQLASQRAAPAETWRFPCLSRQLQGSRPVLEPTCLRTEAFAWAVDGRSTERTKRSQDLGSSPGSAPGARRIPDVTFSDMTTEVPRVVQLIGLPWAVTSAISLQPDVVSSVHSILWRPLRNHHHHHITSTAIIIVLIRIGIV